VLNIATPYGEISVINEPAYSFGSADNVRTYPFAKCLMPGARPISVHGLLLNDKPLAAFGATGGATGIHEHSALWLNGHLLLAICDSVVSVKLHPFELCWALRVDDATCFGLHLHQQSGCLLSHGELSMTRFTEAGAIVWQSGGYDIFTGSLVFNDEFISIKDFNGYEHRLGYIDGKLFA